MREVSHHASTLFALSPSSSLRWRCKILSVQSVSWSKSRRKQSFDGAERRISAKVPMATAKRSSWWSHDPMDHGCDFLINPTELPYTSKFKVQAITNLCASYSPHKWNLWNKIVEVVSWKNIFKRDSEPLTPCDSYRTFNFIKRSCQTQTRNRVLACTASIEVWSSKLGEQPHACTLNQHSVWRRFTISGESIRFHWLYISTYMIHLMPRTACGFLLPRALISLFFFRYGRPSSIQRNNSSFNESLRCTICHW